MTIPDFILVDDIPEELGRIPIDPDEDAEEIEIEITVDLDSIEGGDCMPIVPYE